MRLIFFFSILSTSLIALPTLASDCVCKADPYSKTYEQKSGVVNTWWGGIRKWSCIYTCESSAGVRVELRGYHRDWYVGQDTGLWGICEGLVYVNEYNAHLERFIWAFSHIGDLDPEHSKSTELKQWAKAHCAPSR